MSCSVEHEKSFITSGPEVSIFDSYIAEPDTSLDRFFAIDCHCA